jgi:uncharacterized membrane protein YgcG
MARYTNVNVYHTTVITPTNTKYAVQEKAAAASPVTGGYKTANGKTYTGATAPKAAFKGTNIVPRAPAGDAVTGKSSTTAPKISTGTNPKPVTGGSKSYSGSSSSGGSKSYSGSSSSGGSKSYSRSSSSSGGRK